MSGRVDAMMAHGITKADAYAAAFSNTIVIEIGILVAAVAVAVVFTRIVNRQQKTTGVRRERKHLSRKHAYEH